MLQELLFRLDRPRPEAERRVDGPRRRCLAVLLDAADGLRETPNARSVLQRLLDAVLGRPGWHAGAPFHEEAWGLGVVALRWYARHALEAVWAAVGAHLFAAGGPVATLDSLLAETLEYDDERDLPDRATRLTTLMDGPVGPVGAESDRYDAIEGALGLRPGRAILNAAIQLARLCGHTCRLAREDRYYLPFLDLGGVDRVSLRHLAQRAESTPTLGDWTRLLVERYAVSQHLRAATHKWATGSGAFNFRRTERGLELEPDVKPWSPEGGQTKVPVALSLFSDLGLVRVRSGRWVTTPRGRKVQAAVEAASR
ncbi:MAG: hypothetical protein Q8P41_14180 [Pseudomonadota bacterium]|nr:hypothetical protein [Pseudomonadota bacterium]